MMQLWLWRFRQGARALGVAGLAGGVLLLLALGLLVFQVWPLQQQVIAQQQEIEQLRVAAQTRTADVPVVTDPLVALPSNHTAAPALGQLETLARAQGFELIRGQYSVVPIGGAALSRWQLILPIEADYPALRAFAATALEQMPNLTLDEIKFERERIEDTNLQAELRFSLFVGAAS